MATLPLATRISQNSQRMTRQNIITSNYGDNNTQVAAWGINSKYEEWSLEWKGLDQTERNTLMSFWNSHGLVVGFAWTAPGGASGGWRFTGDGLTETSNGWFYDISAKVRYYPDLVVTP